MSNLKAFLKKEFIRSKFFDHLAIIYYFRQSSKKIEKKKKMTNLDSF